MYYIMNNNNDYLYGLGYNEKHLWTENKEFALSFEDMESALHFCKNNNVYFLGIDYIPCEER